MNNIIYKSPIGDIMLSSTDEAITGVWFNDRIKTSAILCSTDKMPEVLKRACDWLSIYFEGRDPGPLLPICFHDTPFREVVWNLLCKIPYGEVITYKELAQSVAKELNVERMSAQAVGGAVGHNPISILIPCHRVIGSDGSLVGYAGGLHIKQKLLQLEHCVIPK